MTEHPTHIGHFGASHLNQPLTTIPERARIACESNFQRAGGQNGRDRVRLPMQTVEMEGDPCEDRCVELRAHSYPRWSPHSEINFWIWYICVWLVRVLCVYVHADLLCGHVWFVHVLCVYVHVCMYMYVYVLVVRWRLGSDLLGVYVWFVCVLVCICTWMHAYVYVSPHGKMAFEIGSAWCVCVVCVCACVYMYMNACICLCQSSW